MTTPQTPGAPLIVTSLFTSLDGVCEADEDWQFPYFDDELFASITSSWARAGAVLMGRRSFAGYDQLRQHHPDSPVVHFLDSVPRYVASTTLNEAGWPGTTILRGDLEEELTRLRTAPGTELLVLGSPTLVRWLLARRRLDVLALIVLPILVGSGARLFQDMEVVNGHLGLRLDAVRSLASGALELRYTIA